MARCHGRTELTVVESRAGASKNRADLWYSIALLVVALLPRLFVAIAWAREPVWDGHYYHFGAERIAEGLGYSEDVMVHGQLVWKPWCHYPVGYSALLGGVYRVFGSGLVVAPVVNAILGAATAVAAYLLARHYLSSKRARIAGALVALHPGLIVYSAAVMTEGLASLLLVLAPLALMTWRGRWRGIVAAGALVGLATLVRPSSLLAAPLLALMVPGHIPARLLRGALASAVAVLMVTPWSLRNCARMDGCAFVSTNGGWNLAIGALTTTGRFQTLHAADGCPIVTGQVQQDRCWAKVGRDAILAAPGHWIALMPKKLGHTFDHESFAIEYLREADPDAWPEERRVAGRQLLSLFHRLLMVIAALGVVARVKPRRDELAQWLPQAAAFAVVVGLGLLGAFSEQHPFFWLAVAIPLIAVVPLPNRPRQGPVGRYLVGLIAVTALTHAVFFGDDRYHLVVTPILCLLAAAALRRPAPVAASGT